MTTRDQPLRVLIVDQFLQLAPIARRHFDPAAVKLVSDGCTYSAMVEAVRRYSPDLILVELTGQSESPFAAIEAVMAANPTPILVLNAHSAPALNPFRALAWAPWTWRNARRTIPLLSGGSCRTSLPCSRRSRSFATSVEIGSSDGSAEPRPRRTSRWSQSRHR